MAAISLSTESVHAGFTLLELLVTLAIMGIVLAIGVPQFKGIIADQRVRTAISDLRGDLIFARADAINNQERVVVETIDGSDWNQGWRVCVAAGQTSYSCDPTKILRVGQALDQHLKSCGSSTSLVALAFRPDGRLDLNPPPTGNDYIRISDDLRDSDASDDKIRTLYFGLNRIAETNENGDANGVTPC